MSTDGGQTNRQTDSHADGRLIRQTDWLKPISLPPQASFAHGLIIICKIRIFDRDDYTAADLTSHCKA